jgi:hypothetical protein
MPQIVETNVSSERKPPRQVWHAAFFEEPCLKFKIRQHG